MKITANMTSAGHAATGFAGRERRDMIHLDDVRLTLPSEAGPVDILRGVDLDVTPGESLGLVGPSGSGKSTLMAVVAGLERPSAGRVRVAGHDLGAMNEDDLALFRRENLGIMFQAFHLVGTMSALENVAIPLELAGARDAFEQAETGLADVGLGHRLHHYPSQLSGGEQQRVGLARALVRKPRLLLADEPTGNLDAETGSDVIELMFRLRATHASTLVLITHDPHLAGRCDRIVEMRDGRLGVGEAFAQAAD